MFMMMMMMQKLWPRNVENLLLLVVSSMTILGRINCQCGSNQNAVYADKLLATINGIYFSDDCYRLCSSNYLCGSWVHDSLLRTCHLKAKSITQYQHLRISNLTNGKFKEAFVGRLLNWMGL